MIIFFCLSLFFLLGCKESEEPVPDPDPAPAVLNKSIINSLASASIDIFSPLTLKFSQAINRPVVLNDTKKDVKYRPVVDKISIETVAIELSWNTDSTEVQIKHNEAFNPNQNYTLTVAAHWEEFLSGAWKIVSWQNAELKEQKELKFTSGEAQLTISDANIEYLYPIPNQYHFLPKESPSGFIKVKQGLAYLFDSNSENWVEFSNGGTKFKENMTYAADKSLLSYTIPAGLLNETIYKVSLVHKNKTTLVESKLKEYYVRTSKFGTFIEKVAAMTLESNAIRGIFIFSRVHYLVNGFTASEYFDDFELETKTEVVNSGGTSYNVPYSSNLIQFQAVFSGNSWYDDNINPLLYAAFTDATFKPKYSRDTTTVGLRPTKTMSLINSGGGKLTTEMVQANSAAAIPPGSGTGPRIYYNTGGVLQQDFIELQSQLASKYLSMPNIPARESRVIWEQFPILGSGAYKFKIKYRLPNGSITSSVSLSIQLTL